MATLTITDLPAPVHQALSARSVRNGREAQLTDEELALFNAVRDTPHEGGQLR